jgi:hypothetical protein
MIILLANACALTTKKKHGPTHQDLAKIAFLQKLPF